VVALFLLALIEMERIPIGVFDSGYGGLTVLSAIRAQLPQYDFIYFGDNARAPYGNRSFDVVYEFTLEAVKFLFEQGCPLVILACNTASAKALRTIQQKDLPALSSSNRVLGVIRPSTEVLGELTHSKHVGILGTQGTINSNSYPIELAKFAPDIEVHQHACPMWVPLIENQQYEHPAGKQFILEDVQQLLSTNEQIDTILLACTHYPVLQEQLQQLVGPNIQIVPQGPIVAEKLAAYLDAHPEMEQRLSKNGEVGFFTSETPVVFNQKASHFFGQKVEAEHHSF
jgi:glutamate racemase